MNNTTADNMNGNNSQVPITPYSSHNTSTNTNTNTITPAHYHHHHAANNNNNHNNIRSEEAIANDAHSAVLNDYRIRQATPDWSSSECFGAELVRNPDGE